jgi:isopenicillin-N N-acyltransferase-like protein
VAGALAYLAATPRLGRNNLILADRAGAMAVFENGHRAHAIRRPADGLLVNTNHFNDPAMAAAFVETEPPPLRGNSFRRYEKAAAALQAAYGDIDLPFARRLMAGHDGPLASLCRHPNDISASSTIAAILFQPGRGVMHICHGQPCQAAYLTFAVA